MINILIILIFLVWNIRIFSNLLSYINLWFVKEYRLDRMLVHLKTKQGRWLYLLPFRKPPISPKTILLFGVGVISVLSFLGFLSNLRINILLQLLIIDILLFPYISLWVWLLFIPTSLYHKYIIQKAINKLKNHKKMTVIGITGSYGKTSVKEFLFTILSEKYQVLKTEASKNSLIGISETIVNNLKPEHEIFIVEMGAYKMGEIARITEKVRPQIGIITAINVQHQDLFGSIENTMQAKFELIRGLSGKNIAIFNADNQYCLEMARWAIKHQKQVFLYSKMNTKITQKYDKLFTASNIKADLISTTGLISDGKSWVNIKTQVLGEHQMSNILAAFAGAIANSMSFAEVGKSITKIRPYKKVLEPIPGINGSTFINDTFNNNPDAAKAAIKYLSLTKGKKILVFQPMIELGKFADSSHEDVGKLAGKYCDRIFLTNPNFSDSFIKGVSSVDDYKKVKILSVNKIAEQIRTSVNPGDMVLFKGKEAENVLSILLK